jgi:hypothetical protein
MSITLYLRFPDEATFRASLPADFIQYGETGSPLPDGVQAIRIIGPMYSGGTYDAQGNVITPPTLVAGWHVNVLGTLPDAWKAYQIHPVTPSGVFGTK